MNILSQRDAYAHAEKILSVYKILLIYYFLCPHGKFLGSIHGGGKKFTTFKHIIMTIVDIKMSWSHEGDLQFGVSRKKGKKLKYVGKGSTHTPGTLRRIPLRFLNRL